VSLSELPAPVAQFLEGLAAGDWTKAAAQCEPAARVLLGPDPGGPRISSWAAGLVSDGPLLQRPLFASDHGGAVTVVTLISHCFGALLLDGPREYEWSFRLCADRIRLLTVSPRPAPPLPRVVTDLITAANLLDLCAVMAPFTPEARVVCSGREYRGQHAIRTWADLRVIGARLTVCVLQVRNRPPLRSHLRCVYDGDFDRRSGEDPFLADVDVRLQGARIAELLITPAADGHA
jgi:hypothetical protein